MKSIMIAVSVLFGFFSTPAYAQEQGRDQKPNLTRASTADTAHFPSELIGTWAGPWSRNPSAVPMEVSIAVWDARAGTGQIKFLTYAMPLCIWTWERVGLAKGERSPGSIALRGRCGSDDLIFRVPIQEARLMKGAYYTEESPYVGILRMNRHEQ